MKTLKKIKHLNKGSTPIPGTLKCFNVLKISFLYPLLKNGGQQGGQFF